MSPTEISLIVALLLLEGIQLTMFWIYHRARFQKSFSQLINQGRFRVLDVLTLEVIALSKPEPYTALSYVWGESNAATSIQCPTSVAFSSADHRGKLSWKVNRDKTPQSIRGAALVVQQLGERYLWVDSLCIDQKNATDKAEIISEMKRSTIQHT